MDPELVVEVKKKYILHWNYRGFIQLPEELREQGGHVQEIYLKWNNLSCLPTWLGALHNLTNLYLQHNQLGLLPDSLGQLLCLSVLDVSHNRLEALTPRIGNLRNLSVFLARDNFLTTLPSEFRMLQSLEILDLSGNSLACLPACVCECCALQELLLDNNHLTCLPISIVYLPHLAALSVSSNKLLHLPMMPFVSSPCLRFNDNIHLNHISLPLGCQVTANSDVNICGSLWDLRTHGCFLGGSIPEEIQNPTLVTVQDLESNVETHLAMPLALKQICSVLQGGPPVPSLYELAMRVSYSFGFHHTIKISYENGTLLLNMNRSALNTNSYKYLPINVKFQLMNGPTTLCFLPCCQQPIFTYGVIWVVPKCCISERRDGVTHVLGTIMFCSVSCSRYYSLWEKHNSNSLENLSDRQMVWKLRSQRTYFEFEKLLQHSQISSTGSKMCGALLDLGKQATHLCSL